MWQRGQVVRSLRGHDKGTFQTILSVEGNYAVVCDGKRRTLLTPKRKKMIHLAPTAVILPEQALLTDKQIRKALSTFDEKLA